MEPLLFENVYVKLLPVPLTILLTLGVATFFSKRSTKQLKVISEEELRKYLAEFEPEPLVFCDKIYQESLPHELDASSVGNAYESMQNLCQSDYNNLRTSQKFKSIANECIQFNGVGSCGPRGFYGTIDVHLSLEDQIADFMQLEETILYSYSLSTMSSAILAYCKKDDLIFCDEQIASTSVDAVKAAKAELIYYKHNDVDDLEEALKRHDNSARRKFLLVEGIYQATGKICRLPELMALRKKYRLRMFLDETISFGSLGKHGRGVTEHYMVDRSDIDLISGSLEHSVPSIGGFCVGSSFVIDHQRLSGLGYCFSASLPPLHSYIAKHTIALFESDPEMVRRLNDVAARVQETLNQLNGFEFTSDPLSPLKVVKLASHNKAANFIAKAKNVGILLASNEQSNSIIFNVNVRMNDAYIEALFKSFDSILSN